MNWLPLRKNNIPLIDRQIEKAIGIHQEVQQSIMEGDILSIQKMSDFQLSIKKRIQEIDQFYNKNCFDERVRFLQAARMKLSRIINQNTLNQKQINVGLPWKQTNDITVSRQSNSSQKKSATPRKKGHKMEKNNNKNQTPINKRQQQRSPINHSMNDYQQEQKEKRTKNKKNQLTLDIPQDDQDNNITFSGVKNGLHFPKRQDNQKLVKSRRKMQVIPSKNRSSAVINEQKINKSPISKADSNVEENSIQNPPKIKINQAGGPGIASRVRGVNNSGHSRTVTQGNSGGNSIKMLNDLIFTIKMTKQEYEDFIEIKKQLNQR